MKGDLILIGGKPCLARKWSYNPYKLIVDSGIRKPNVTLPDGSTKSYDEFVAAAELVTCRIIVKDASGNVLAQSSDRPYYIDGGGNRVQVWRGVYSAERCVRLAAAARVEIKKTYARNSVMSPEVPLSELEPGLAVRDFEVVGYMSPSFGMGYAGVVPVVSYKIDVIGLDGNVSFSNDVVWPVSQSVIPFEAWTEADWTGNLAASYDETSDGYGRTVASLENVKGIVTGQSADVDLCLPVFSFGKSNFRFRDANYATHDVYCMLSSFAADAIRAYEFGGETHKSFYGKTYAVLKMPVSFPFSYSS